MTNTPKPQATTLDEIAEQLLEMGFANKPGSTKGRMFSMRFYNKELEQYILALITEANKAGYRKGYEHCLVGKAPTQQLKENKE